MSGKNVWEKRAGEREKESEEKKTGKAGIIKEKEEEEVTSEYRSTERLKKALEMKKK